MTLLRDQELREHLLSWPTILEDAAEQQRENRVIVLQRLDPQIARATNPGPIDQLYLDLLADLTFERGGEPVRLEVTRELLGVLGTRLINSTLSVQELQSLHDQIVAIQALLDRR